MVTLTLVLPLFPCFNCLLWLLLMFSSLYLPPPPPLESVLPLHNFPVYKTSLPYHCFPVTLFSIGHFTIIFYLTRLVHHYFLIVRRWGLCFGFDTGEGFEELLLSVCSQNLAIKLHKMAFTFFVDIIFVDLEPISITFEFQFEIFVSN